MLELIFKGLLQWLFDMIINITEYLVNSLLEIFTMDLAYFESTIPITSDIVQIMIGTGWALLLGNLVFQAMKSMASGLGFDGEDPRTLFTRTFVMTFLLVFSREVCNIGLGITNTVIGMLQVPDVVQVPQLAETTFSVPGDASWLLVIIIGIILIVQIVKLFFEIGERYVIVAVLTILSPLAFSMGGSKNTADIFKGWVRMFASMCLMMVLSLIFLKMILSAMSIVPSGVAVIPWTVFIVAIARVGRKIDGLIARVGLNPASTGDPLGHSRIPGMLSYMVVKNMAKSIQSASAAEAASGKGKSAPSGTGGGRTLPAAGTAAGGTASGRAPDRPPIGSSAASDAGTGSTAHLSTAPLGVHERGEGARPGAASTTGDGGYSGPSRTAMEKPGSYASGKSVPARPESPAAPSAAKTEAGKGAYSTMDGRMEKPHGSAASSARRLDEAGKAHDASGKLPRPSTDGVSRHTATSGAGAKEERGTRPGLEAGKTPMRPIESIKPITASADKPAGKVPSREDALKKAGTEKLTKPTERPGAGTMTPKIPKTAAKKTAGSKEPAPTPRPPSGNAATVSKGSAHISTHTHASTAGTGEATSARPTAPGNIHASPPAVKSISGKPPVAKNANLQKPLNPSVSADTRPEVHKKPQVQENQKGVLTEQKSDTPQASRGTIQGRSKATRPDISASEKNTSPANASKNNTAASNPAKTEPAKSVAGQGVQQTTIRQNRGTNNNRPKNPGNEVNSKPKSEPIKHEVSKKAPTIKNSDIQKNSIPPDKKQRPTSDHKGGSDK